MTIDRRTFLRRIGGGLLAVAAAPVLVPTAAPLFIPSDRLEMGVPRRLAAAIASGRGPGALSPGAVPMRLNQDEFSMEWGGRLPAGSVVTVDERTALRWIANRIGAPTESWMRSASDAEQRAIVAQAVPDPWRFRSRFRSAEELGTTMPIPPSTPPDDGEWFRRTALTILAEDAYAPV
jgi:hypothetical protein